MRFIARITDRKPTEEGSGEEAMLTDMIAEVDPTIAESLAATKLEAQARSAKKLEKKSQSYFLLPNIHYNSTYSDNLS